MFRLSISPNLVIVESPDYRPDTMLYFDIAIDADSVVMTFANVAGGAQPLKGSDGVFRARDYVGSVLYYTVVNLKSVELASRSDGLTIFSPMNWETLFDVVAGSDTLAHNTNNYIFTLSKLKVGDQVYMPDSPQTGTMTILKDLWVAGLSNGTPDFWQLQIDQSGQIIQTDGNRLKLVSEMPQPTVAAKYSVNTPIWLKNGQRGIIYSVVWDGTRWGYSVLMDDGTQTAYLPDSTIASDFTFAAPQGDVVTHPVMPIPASSNWGWVLAAAITALVLWPKKRKKSLARR